MSHADLQPVDSPDTSAEHEPGANAAATTPAPSDHKRRRPNFKLIEDLQARVGEQDFELRALHEVVKDQRDVIAEHENSLAYARQEKDAILRRLWKWSGFWCVVGGLAGALVGHAL